MPSFEPAHIETFNKGLLAEKIKTANAILKSCTLCPRKCEVDRLSGETGICKTGDKTYISSFNAHFGEEAPLVGINGSGTIFFYPLQSAMHLLPELRHQPPGTRRGDVK